MKEHENVSFSIALDLLKMGRHVAREGWNGKFQHLALQVPDNDSKMRKPYIYISPVDGELVPWVASQTDLLSGDWYSIPQDKLNA